MIEDILLNLVNGLQDTDLTHKSKDRLLEAIKVLEPQLQIDGAIRAYEAACLGYSKAWNEDDAADFRKQATCAFNFSPLKV